MTFLQGEMALEEYIEAHDPTHEVNALTARQELLEANNLLASLAEGSSQVSKLLFSSCFLAWRNKIDVNNKYLYKLFSYATMHEYALFIIE